MFLMSCKTKLPVNQRGLSLIELMIGMLLGLVLLGGVILVFTSSSEVNRNRMAMSAISDNARFALEHMNRHLRMTDSGTFEYDGSTIRARLINSGFISYTIDSDAGEILFDDGDGEVTLVDGINDWVFDFGVGDMTSNTLGYQETASLSDQLWSIRVNLLLEDPSNRGRPLELGNNTVSTTIALRNPLLAAISGNEFEPTLPDDQEGNGDSNGSDGGESGTPGDDGDPGDTETPPNGDVDPETGQPLPDQPVVCEVDNVTVAGIHDASAVLDEPPAVIARQGEFLGCDSSGVVRQCQGRAGSGQRNFSVLLEFFGPGNGYTRRVVDFQCNPNR